MKSCEKIQKLKASERDSNSQPHNVMRNVGMEGGGGGGGEVLAYIHFHSLTKMLKLNYQSDLISVHQAVKFKPSKVEPEHLIQVALTTKIIHIL